ncbi:hypothetical protein ASG29_12680 [Sphingomonas sp. Leaf412]|nr:hypothetical protein ASG29_12680 [Sphingomonas sp. Leaf412]
MFGGAFGAAIYAIAATVAPRMAQIVDVLFARPQPRFAPLTELVHAERRIAVRRWATASARGSFRPREAA